MSDLVENIEPISADGVAELLAQEGIVAWVNGQAEIGPRALGNRSLNPLDPHWDRRKDTTDTVHHALDVMVTEQLQQRAAARAANDWAAADRARDRLVAAGIEVTDTADGPQWALR